MATRQAAAIIFPFRSVILRAMPALLQLRNPCLTGLARGEHDCHRTSSGAFMSRPSHGHSLDSVIDAYAPGVDRSLLRKNLALTPEQRLLQLQQLVRFAAELRRAGQRAARSDSA